jgi:signal transduction histidine kinase
MIAPQAHAKGLEIDDTACRPDVIAIADRAKVEQIIINLVSNAVKFTAPGGTVTLSCENVDARCAAVVVRDTGVGIPGDQLEAIFEPFVQVGRTLTANREGTGLGLAISRDLAQAMRGDITVTSTLDVGSKFTLVLPRADTA